MKELFSTNIFKILSLFRQTYVQPPNVHHVALHPYPPQHFQQIPVPKFLTRPHVYVTHYVPNRQLPLT